MSRLLLIIVGLVATYVLARWCAVNHAPRIQDDLTFQTRAALATSDLRVVEVTADGRDLVLTGIVPDDAARERAVAVATDIEGVYRVEDQLQVIAPPPVASVPEPMVPVLPTERIAEPEPVLEPEIMPPEPALEAKQAAVSCQAEFNSVLSTDTIRFASNSTEVSDTSFALLDQLVEIAGKCPNAQVEVAGHTDASGGDAANLRLSEGRAISVVEYLVSKGVAANRLNAVGYGETKPIAENETPQGRAQNRRIEFSVTGLEQ